MSHEEWEVCENCVCFFRTAEWEGLCFAFSEDGEQTATNNGCEYFSEENIDDITKKARERIERQEVSHGA